LQRGSYGLWGAEHLLPVELHKKLLALAAVGLLFSAATWLILPAIIPIGGAASGVRVSRLVYPAPLARSIAAPAGGSWTIPVDAVRVGDATFVLDTGNNRVLKLDSAGRVIATFGGQLSARVSLQLPMAIATDGQRLFIANSLDPSIVVMDLSGEVQRALLLPAGVNGKPARPVGVAVLPDGGVVVSDAENHQVLRFTEGGDVLWTAGTGTRAGGAEGFNVPGALAVDAAGNVYVVDTLNARVVELSPGGAFLREFGRRGDTAGSLARPKGVAVDAAGRVFVSDGLLVAVEVFAPDGRYLGLIGRRDMRDLNSGSLFTAPAGLSIADGSLLVTDRYAGVLSFSLR
jgi:sugar lactone lactonase YvrE